MEYIFGSDILYDKLTDIIFIDDNLADKDSLLKHITVLYQHYIDAGITIEQEDIVGDGSDKEKNILMLKFIFWIAKFDLLLDVKKIKDGGDSDDIFDFVSKFTFNTLVGDYDIEEIDQKMLHVFSFFGTRVNVRQEKVDNMYHEIVKYYIESGGYDINLLVKLRSMNLLAYYLQNYCDDEDRDQVLDDVCNQLTERLSISYTYTKEGDVTIPSFYNSDRIEVIDTRHLNWKIRVFIEQ